MMSNTPFFQVRSLQFAGLFFVLLSSACTAYRFDPALERRAVRQSVQIHRSIPDLFAYMGNSAYARDWSVFVDHISVLNPAEVPDGAVGSKRRCFKHEDEKGLQWDEEILLVEPSRMRRLSIYNMKKFPVKSAYLWTEQWYEPLGHNQCRLSLVLYLKPGASWTDHFKMRLMAWRIRRIFKNNLLNIKQINERI